MLCSAPPLWPARKFVVLFYANISLMSTFRLLVIIVMMLLGLLAPRPWLGAQYNWELLSASPQNGQKQDDVFFLDADKGWSVNGSGRVYRTTDHGAHWAPLGEGLPDACYANILRGAIALDHADPCGIYFGTTAGQVFASADGESWQTLPGTLPRVLSVTAYRT